jgi:hypothetical protein
MTKACRIGDHDFATFGQCALSSELNKEGNRLLYRAWHLRDLAWQEDDEGQIGFVARKWKTTYRIAVGTFGDRLHEKTRIQAEKTPHDELTLFHIVCDEAYVDDDSKGRPRWSVWYDKEHEQVIEKIPIWGRHYIIPRWLTLWSQYAHSPAVTAGLADARLLQAMTFTLLEASERSTEPPLIATKDVLQSTPAIYAGGVTWVDKDYDERFGDALKPFPQDYSGIAHGLEMSAQTQALIKEAFFLNKLSPFNPTSDPEMTAFQAGQLVQEYVRNALPIFEPMEQEYSAALCDETFGIMLRAGAFGSPSDWPTELHEMELEFTFESPLHDAIGKEKGQKFLEAKALIAEAIALDPGAQYQVDAKEALRDALEGIRVPTGWTRSRDEVDAAIERDEEERMQQQLLESMQQGASAAKDLGAASESFQEGQAVI